MATLCRINWRTRLSSIPRTRPLWRQPSHHSGNRPSSSSFTTATPTSTTAAAAAAAAAAEAPWHTRAAHASSRVQIYTSRTHDPYLNLSAEHFLLQTSHPDSTVLFLYANDPCVVIGRNQNPWLEVNLGLLRSYRAAAGGAMDLAGGRAGGEGQEGHHGDGGRSATKSVALVRRRSGGGAVFHDRGNVNYSVICPPALFDRDRHAEMVVRALRSLGEPTARVNARHDIVVDGEGEGSRSGDGGAEETFKISGSAYKLTRLRSLHHGTCLLSSPNLGDIGRLLRSPAEGYIKARGVESVRSRIRNVGIGSEEFMEAVVGEFTAMYGPPDLHAVMGEGKDAPDFAHEKIQKGFEELTSQEWIYNQTPLFTFSTHPFEEDPRQRPSFPPGVPNDFRATITARHGQIQHAEISGFDGKQLEGQYINTIADWRQILQRRGLAASEPVGDWFNHLFGMGTQS